MLNSAQDQNYFKSMKEEQKEKAKNNKEALNLEPNFQFYFDGQKYELELDDVVSVEKQVTGGPLIKLRQETGLANLGNRKELLTVRLTKNSVTYSIDEVSETEITSTGSYFLSSSDGIFQVDGNEIQLTEEGETIKVEMNRIQTASITKDSLLEAEFSLNNEVNFQINNKNQIIVRKKYTFKAETPKT